MLNGARWGKEDNSVKLKASSERKLLVHDS